MRRDWGEWRDLVERQRRGGLSVAEFCRREDISANSFYRWRRIFADEAEASFVRVAVVQQRPIEVALPCGATVHVAADRDVLRELFAALSSVEANDA